MESGSLNFREGSLSTSKSLCLSSASSVDVELTAVRLDSLKNDLKLGFESSNNFSYQPSNESIMTAEGSDYLTQSSIQVSIASVFEDDRNYLDDIKRRASVIENVIARDRYELLTDFNSSTSSSKNSDIGY